MSQRTNAPVPVSQPVGTPASSPFRNTIAGAGIVESQSENISIGTPVPGIVADVFVKVGSRVEAGAPLFQIDSRSQVAEVSVRKAALQTARQKLERLQHLPRPEDVEPVRARVRAAEASLADARLQLQIAEAANRSLAGSVSMEAMSRRRWAVDNGTAQLSEATSQLALVEAGAWSRDLEVAKADVAAAEAEVAAAETELAKLTIRAPMDCDILKVNIRKGEYAPSGNTDAPLILVGDLQRLHVRADIDESDIWRFRPEAPAWALVRGNATLRAPIRFVRAEPWVIPKKSLTGESTERVDTRVLQVIYQFEPNAIPVYVGEQVDVFMDLDAAESQPARR
jgi:multidrug efflux pump subunit AcrA (membrane-fusion protein)